MQFTIEISDFHAALQKMSVPQKPLHAILNGVAMVVDNGNLILSSFDLKQSVTTKIQLGLDSIDGKIVVQSDIIEIVGKLYKRGGRATVELIDNSIRLTVGKPTSPSVFEFNTFDYSEYPELFSVDSDDIYELPAEFIDALTFVSATASTDETKQILCCVNVKSDGEYLHLAATDGHRLHYQKLVFAGEKFEFNLPTSIFAYLKSLSHFNLSIDNGIVSFADNETVVSSRVVEGDYPDYFRLLPTTFDYVITVDNTTISDSLNLLTSYHIPTLNLDTTIDGNLSLSVNNDGRAIATEHISCNGTFYKFALNITYLLKSIKSAKSKHVTFHGNGSLKPIILTYGDDGQVVMNKLSLLMPMEVKN